MVTRNGLRTSTLMLAVVASLSTATQARSLIIDDFSTPQSVAAFDPSTNSAAQTSGPGVLGSERDLAVSRSSGFGVTMGASGGRLVYSHVVDGVGTGTVTWDGADGASALDPTGLGGVDFTDGGASTAIALDLLVDDVAVTFTLSAYTDGVNFSTIDFVLPGGVPPQQTLIVDFADFVIAGGTGVDFSGVGAFQILIDGSALSTLNVEFDNVRTIPTPEPGTALLLMTGLAGMAWLRGRSARTRS